MAGPCVPRQPSCSDSPVRRLKMSPTPRPTWPSGQMPAACFLRTPHSLCACRPLVFAIRRLAGREPCLLLALEHADAVAVFCSHQVRTARVRRPMWLKPRGALVSIFPLDWEGVFRGLRWAVGSEFGWNVCQKIENDVYLLRFTFILPGVAGMVTLALASIRLSDQWS